MAVLTLSVTVLIGMASSASAASVFTTTLTGSEEVPGRGDPDGFGFAVVVAIPEVGLVCYSVAVYGIVPANAAHIHEAPRGVAGPVVVGLLAPSSGGSGGCISNQAEAEDIAEDPSDYYVNVHNVEFPGGALRGQLG